MNFFILILFVIIICSCSPKRVGGWCDYISKSQTDVIKGIFIIIVFYSHILGYIEKSGYTFSVKYDGIYLFFIRHIGQLMVVMFLFYSGFGVMSSLEAKKSIYIKTFLCKRILPTLANFSIAVVFFLISGLLLNHSFKFSRILLSLIGWESIGNSNWYIFTILLCYIGFYLSYLASPKRVALLSFLFSVFIIIILSFYKPSYWYNTILAFNAGIFFKKHTKKIQYYINNHYDKCLCFILIWGIFFIISKLNIHYIGYNLYSIAFALLIVLLCWKIRIRNSLLQWFGIHLFPLYIYQRLPMMLLYEFEGGYIPKNHTYIYIISCFIITIIIAYLYKFWQIKEISINCKKLIR